MTFAEGRVTERPATENDTQEPNSVVAIPVSDTMI